MSATLVRQFAGVLASGRLEELAEIVAERCEDRNPLPLQPPGRAGVALKLAWWRALKPQARSVVREAEDTPAGARARWETLPGPGEPAEIYEGRFTVQGGLITAFEVDRVG